MKKTCLQRSGTLLVLALLLAFMSTGSLSICDAFILGEPTPDGPDINVTVKAGQAVTDFAEASGFYYLFSICPVGSLPPGAYIRTVRDYTYFPGVVSVDLVTSPGTPPGQYTATYFATRQGLIFFAEDFDSGTFNLTVEPPDVTLTACFYAYSVGEIHRVNSPIGFYSDCSTESESNPIVQRKWWWNYNGNPNSTPDQTDTSTPTDHTYSSAGTKTVRLVVRAQDGSESAITHSVTVHP